MFRKLDLTWSTCRVYPFEKVTGFSIKLVLPDAGLSTWFATSKTIPWCLQDYSKSLEHIHIWATGSPLSDGKLPTRPALDVQCV